VLSAISEVFWVWLRGLAWAIGLALLGIAALRGFAALDGGVACRGLVEDARVQRPERPGVDGYTVRDRMIYFSALACNLGLLED